MRSIGSKVTAILAGICLLLLELPWMNSVRAREGEITDFEELDLEELLDVVYTAAKHQQDIGDSPSAIWVIGREDIETSGATTIADLLRMVPGMDVTVVSPMFSSVSTRVPWTDENNVFLILVDGREANIELLGFVFWDTIPVTLDDIERIEIIRGPASSLYGTNALSGVINIQTRAVPQETSGRAGISCGEIGTFQASLRGTTRIKDWGLSLGLISDQAGTFSDFRILSRKSYRLRSVIERRWSEAHRLRLDAGFSHLEGATSSAMGNIAGKLRGASTQLVYQRENLRGQIYWVGGFADFSLDASLDYGKIRLAEIRPLDVDGHMVDGELQWTAPRFWEPLLIITGVMVRTFWVFSDDLLDGKTYSDITSPDYHRPGIRHFEWRTGAFAHLEVEPADWVTVTGGLRFDWNSETGEFFSPRLAAVLRPSPGQFVRLGAARSFRKPSFSESRIHVMVDFPSDSPITDKEGFREFMSRVLGSDLLENEQIWSFEGGYLLRLFDERLTLSLDLYYTLYSGQVALAREIINTSQGLPDLEASIVRFENTANRTGTWGTELSVRWRISRALSLLAAWTHREVLNLDSDVIHDTSPKNLIILGSRYRSAMGLLGSLYFFTRSEFWDRFMTSPAGWLEPRLEIHLEHEALILGKLGWRWQSALGMDLEAGLKLFLPVSFFSGPLFRYRERGGILLHSGENYGGDHLCRMVTGYLQGSF